MNKNTYKKLLNSNDGMRYKNYYYKACEGCLEIILNENLIAEITVRLNGWNHQKEYCFIRFYDKDFKRIMTLELNYFINTKNALKRIFHKNITALLPF